MLVVGRLRKIVAYALAAISVGAIVWCVAVASPVTRSAPSPEPPSPSLLEVYGAQEHSPRTPPELTTEVTIADATDADLAVVPQGRLDERARQLKITVVHRLVLDRTDLLATLLRSEGPFPDDIQGFTDRRLGAVKADGGSAVLAPTSRLAPVLTTSGSRTTVRFTITMLRQVGNDALPQLDFVPPTEQGAVSAREITLIAPTWTVIRVERVTPDREQAGRLVFNAYTAPVSVRLAHESYGRPDAEQTDLFSWTPILSVFTAIALTVFLGRALGASWWQRTPNRELATGIALCVVALLLAMLLARMPYLGPVILFGAVPVLALRHARRIVPDRPPWTSKDALLVTGLGVLVASGMLFWAFVHGQVPPLTLAVGTVTAALAAAGSAVAFGADLGIAVLVARLAAVTAGVAVAALALALWVRALMSGGYFPPDSVRLVLALCWSLIPIAGIAVATRSWSRVAIVVAVLGSLLLLGWPTEWLDAGSWSVQPDQITPTTPPPLVFGQPLNEVTRGALGLLLLTFALLVLRLRRLGATPDAMANPAVVATVIVCLMVLYLTPRTDPDSTAIDLPLPSLAITSLVAWAAAIWLLSGPRPEIAEPSSRAEHRELIRNALHRRVLHGSEQELYRLSRGKLGSGELTMEDFERQRLDLDRALTLDPPHTETAFATSAGCTPWQNGLAAFVVSLLLSLPFALIYGWPDGPELTTWVFDARFMFTLPAFGFFYGYFYPRLRGTQPVTKALYVMSVALVTELSAYVPSLVDPDIGGFDKLQVVAIVVGQGALVFIGLGLYWEWRIMFAAGEPWARVRNVRSVRSLATPLVAVVIAAGTTAATSAAGQTVDRILKGDTATSQGGP
ncbi:hypothetical protein ACFSKW_31045 [Nonomuraea mangrovi]|uniref:Uncharacterized protein n=1 Tax=Nonomuraea mangrovi TaxID=2316207 RepID=A0ABW4T3F3_9ACTN